MYIVERHPFGTIDRVEGAIRADPSAHFIHDLATSSPGMSLAALRAASDLVEKVSEARWRAAPAVRLVSAERRLRIVASAGRLAV